MDGEPGFEIRYLYNGLNPSSVRGRARGRVTSKYPLKAGDIQVESTMIDEGIKNTFHIDVFVPYSSFANKLTGDRLTELLSQIGE